MRAPSSPQQNSYTHSSYVAPYYQPFNLAFCTAAPVQHQLTPAQKRQKLEQDFAAGFPADEDIPLEFVPTSPTPPFLPTVEVMPIRPFNPHINLQRASAPASPITVSTSLSTHSTPASSPSRVTIMSAHNSPGDFQLYDDTYDRYNSKRRTIRNFENPAQSRFNHGYDSSMAQPLDYYDRQYLQAPQSQQQQFGTQGLSNNRTVMHSDDEELPALSPHHGQYSSRLSASDMDLHSPPTPIASPESANGDGCGSVQVAREDACQYIESWIDHYLLFGSEIQHPVDPPKLGRTVSDAIQDELYNPGVAPGIEHAAHSSTCTTPSKVAYLYQQGQNPHSPSPIIRTHSCSPFPADSSYGQFPVCNQSSTVAMVPSGFASARGEREKQIAADQATLKKHMENDFLGLEDAAFTTISPKDAYHDEFNEQPQEGVKGSLFASQEDVYSQNGSVQSGSYKSSVHDDEDEELYNLKREETQESYGSMATSRRESDASVNFHPMFPTNHYPPSLGYQSYNGYGNYADVPKNDSEFATPSNTHPESPLSKPEDSKANRGGYTCTVPGCNQRFPTTNKMSKHRREAHRHTSPGSRGDGIARSHHPGPHKCNRINPTTNKPCNTVFSRPYDLTRHEDTIHNTHREKVRCEICNDEKTFSRQDALTRHKKVKHGIDK